MGKSASSPNEILYGSEHKCQYQRFLVWRQIRDRRKQQNESEEAEIWFWVWVSAEVLGFPLLFSSNDEAKPYDFCYSSLVCSNLNLNLACTVDIIDNRPGSGQRAGGAPVCGS